MPDKHNNDGNGTEGHIGNSTGKDQHTSEKVIVPASITPGIAGVVLRATLETFGPAGDAEMNFTVKWSATTLAEAQHNIANRTRTVSGPNIQPYEGIDAKGVLSAEASKPPNPQ